MQHCWRKLVFVLSLGVAVPLFADERLAELEPLIGTWKCKTASAEIESSFRWILDNNFIEHDHTLRLFGQTHRVKEVIGRDPVTKSIKGWIFTTNGVATSTYRREGDAWKIDVVLTRNDESESKKQKTLLIEGNTLSITNKSAALPEFLKLAFKREPRPDTE